MRRHTEIYGSSAAVDDRGSAHDLGSRRRCDLNRLAGGLPCREYIFDDEHTIVRRERKATPQTERRTTRSLREDRPNAERTRHLVPDDQSAERRGQHD